VVVVVVALTAGPVAFPAAGPKSSPPSVVVATAAGVADVADGVGAAVLGVGVALVVFTGLAVALAAGTSACVLALTFASRRARGKGPNPKSSTATAAGAAPASDGCAANSCTPEAKAAQAARQAQRGWSRPMAREAGPQCPRSLASCLAWGVHAQAAR